MAYTRFKHSLNKSLNQVLRSPFWVKLKQKAEQGKPHEKSKTLSGKTIQNYSKTNLNQSRY
jgi:hypothetical protein